MARGRQLSQLLNQLQAEAGMSLLPASSVSSKEHRIQLLNRTQARLYASFDWDFALIKRDTDLGQGARYVGQPADMDFERTDYCAIAVAGTSDWRRLDYGINEAHYRQVAEGTEGSPQRWGPSEGGFIEIWPVPDDAYTLRFRGYQLLPVMVDESDRAILDDTLIVLFAAAELMKRAKLPDYEDKQREAQLHFTRLRSQMGGNKRDPFVNGGGMTGLIGDYQVPPVRGLDYVE